VRLYTQDGQNWRFDETHPARISLSEASESFYRCLAYGAVETGSQHSLGPLAAALRCKGVPVANIVDSNSSYWFIQAAWFRPRKCSHKGCITLVRRGNLLRGFCDVHAEDAGPAVSRPVPHELVVDAPAPPRAPVLPIRPLVDHERRTEEPFAQAIKALMGERRLSYRQLAYRAELTAGYLNHLTKGTRPVPRGNVIVQVARALCVEPEFFLEYRRATATTTQRALAH